MRQLALQSGISPSQITHYEDHTQVPGIESVRKLARALDVPILHLAYGEEMSELEKHMAEAENLPESSRSVILRVIKEQIYITRHQKLDEEMAKELT